MYIGQRHKTVPQVSGQMVQWARRVLPSRRVKLIGDPALAIIADVVKRWSIEVTFEENWAHLGVETQRQWNDQAIERTTPALFGLFSLVTLLAQALCPNGQLPLPQSAWYHKTEASFSDVLALVRRALWGNFNYQTSAVDPDMLLIPRSDLERLASAICY